MNALKSTVLSILILAGVNSFAQKTFHLKQNFPIGKKYDFSIVSDQIITQKVGGQTMNMNQNIGTDYTFNVKNGDDRLKDVEVIYNRMFMKSSTMGNTMNVDSNDSDTTKNNPLRGLTNAGFTMSLTPNGEVKTVVGVDKMISDIAFRSSKDSVAVKQIKATLSQQFNAESMRHTMETSLKIYPEKAIKIGESWVINSKMQISMPIETITTYTLTEVKDGIAYLDLRGTLVSKGSFKNMGNEIQSDLSGTNIGDAELDLATGFILKSHSRVDLTGTMQTAGQTIEFEMQGINRIEGKEIK
ncbi:DUF6263 family protein [Pedobacter sp. AW1-32]|uniref:DUF6263 family protein n=1 Tax=Pedobacter sp. AW1-32 TaxID=3383026 RepID=UPI003FEE8CD7